MLENSKVDLSRASKEREESKGILKYTLALDYKEVTCSPNEKNYVDEVLKNTQACCGNIFVLPKYNFFGTHKNANELRYLSRSKPTCEQIDGKNELCELILNNCIMSCFHALMSEYLSDLTITAYQIVNYLNKDKGLMGMLRDKDWKEEKGQISYDPDSYGIGKEKIERSGKASTYGTIFKGRDKIIKNAFPFLVKREKGNRETTYVKFQYSLICDAIKSASLPKLKVWNDSASISNVHRFFACMKSMDKKITPSLHPYKKVQDDDMLIAEEKVVDTLYYYYLSERMFNHNLLYSILKNISEKEREKKYYIRGTALLETIASCANLPNPFSRPYFLKFAFDFMDEETTSHNDFWQAHDFYQRLNLAHISLNPIGFHFDHWIQQYQMFIKYFSEYVFPLYDWCFTNMLLEGIEAAFPDISYKETLWKAIELLESYMKENYKKIMCPIMRDDMDGLDIFASKQYDWLQEKFNVDEMKTLFNATFNNGNHDLNLFPVTLSRFRGERLKDIQDLYMEFLVFPRRDNKGKAPTFS